MWFILYLSIGVIFTEFTTKNDYSRVTRQNFYSYFEEMVMWFPKLITLKY